MFVIALYKQLLLTVKSKAFLVVSPLKINLGREERGGDFIGLPSFRYLPEVEFICV